jgi:hypothetical protein
MNDLTTIKPLSAAVADAARTDSGRAGGNPVWKPAIRWHIQEIAVLAPIR